MVLLRSLFLSGEPLVCKDAADTNDDGKLTISDAVYLLRYFFLSGEAPPAPYPGCGEDRTEDSLDCAIGNACAK